VPVISFEKAAQKIPKLPVMLEFVSIPWAMMVNMMVVLLTNWRGGK